VDDFEQLLAGGLASHPSQNRMLFKLQAIPTSWIEIPATDPSALHSEVSSADFTVGFQRNLLLKRNLLDQKSIKSHPVLQPNSPPTPWFATKKKRPHRMTFDLFFQPKGS